MSLSAAQKAAQKNKKKKRVRQIPAGRQNGNEEGHLADTERVDQLHRYGNRGDLDRHGYHCRIGRRICPVIPSASRTDRLGGGRRGIWKKLVCHSYVFGV